MSTYHLVQKAQFEEAFSDLSNLNLYVCAFRHPDSGHWVLLFADHQLNHWVLEAQRGGPRQFRTLDTLQKYVSDALGSMYLQIGDFMPGDLASILRRK